MCMLVLHHEGAPMLASLTAPAIYKRILEWSDDVELFRVWSVPTDDSYAVAADITEQFAKTWSIEFPFGDGIEPHDYLAPFPAFIREAARDHLIRKWQGRMARQDQSFVPDPLRQAS